MASSPGCWAVYGQVLAREYGDASYRDVRRLSVDAYAVQHPGGRDRQSIQSVGLHLVRLCLLLEQGLHPDKANTVMSRTARSKEELVWLAPPASLGAFTAADVAVAGTTMEHKAAVRAWARAAWDAWAPHHEQVRSWLRLAG